MYIIVSQSVQSLAERAVNDRMKKAGQVDNYNLFDKKKSGGKDQSLPGCDDCVFVCFLRCCCIRREGAILVEDPDALNDDLRSDDESALQASVMTSETGQSVDLPQEVNVGYHAPGLINSRRVEPTRRG